MDHRTTTLAEVKLNPYLVADLMQKAELVTVVRYSDQVRAVDAVSPLIEMHEALQTLSRINEDRRTGKWMDDEERQSLVDAHNEAVHVLARAKARCLANADVVAIVASLA